MIKKTQVVLKQT